jgi:hypothetical protein
MTTATCGFTGSCTLTHPSTGGSKAQYLLIHCLTPGCLRAARRCVPTVPSYQHRVAAAAPYHWPRGRSALCRNTDAKIQCADHWHTSIVIFSHTHVIIDYRYNMRIIEPLSTVWHTETTWSLCWNVLLHGGQLSYSRARSEFECAELQCRLLRKNNTHWILVQQLYTIKKLKFCTQPQASSAIISG